jgi:hypothetical protein
MMTLPLIVQDAQPAGHKIVLFSNMAIENYPQLVHDPLMNENP